MFSEEDGFRFHFSMWVSVDELRVIIEREGILSDCTGTGHAVTRCCILFRESGQFEVPISFAKIDSLLGIDAKTAWNHWRQFKKNWSRPWCDRKTETFIGGSDGCHFRLCSCRVPCPAPSLMQLTSMVCPLRVSY
jgi:hypothetical protein